MVWTGTSYCRSTLDNGGREAALRVRRGALHEQDHRMGVDDLGDVSLGRFGACRFRHEHSPSAISLDHFGASVVSITPDQVRARDGTATFWMPVAG